MSNTFKATPERLLARASALVSQGRFKEAELAAAQGLAMKPGDSVLMSCVAYALIMQKQYVKAQRVLRVLLDQHPSFAPACQMMGICYQLSSQFAEALEWFRRALVLEPGSSFGKIDAARCLAELGQLDEATVFLKDALESNAQDHAAMSLLVGLRILTGRDLSDVFSRAAGVRDLPAGLPKLAELNAPRAPRSAVAVTSAPLSGDRALTMLVGLRTVAFGLQGAGYAVESAIKPPQRTWGEEADNALKIIKPAEIQAGDREQPASKYQIVVGMTNFRIPDGQSALFVSGPPAYTRGFRQVVSGLAKANLAIDLAVTDAGTQKLAEALWGRKVLRWPSMYQPDFLDPLRAEKPLATRPIALLYAASWENPEAQRALWRMDKQLAKLGDCLVEAARGRFAEALPDIAQGVLAAERVELDLTSDPGARWLDWVNKYLRAEHKKRVLSVLSRYPGHFFLAGRRPPLEFHPKARVEKEVNYPLYLDLMHESRAVVATMPSYMSGAVSERVTDPLVRGAVVIAARNAGLRDSGLVMGREVLDYGFAEDELRAQVECALDGGANVQAVADAGRAAAMGLFDPVRQMERLMAEWQELILSRRE